MNFSDVDEDSFTFENSTMRGMRWWWSGDPEFFPDPPRVVKSDTYVYGDDIYGNTEINTEFDCVEFAGVTWGRNLSFNVSYELGEPPGNGPFVNQVIYDGEEILCIPVSPPFDNPIPNYTFFLGEG